MKLLGRWMQLAVLARVPLLVGGGLLVLAALGGREGPATVSNMMLMNSLLQLALVVFLALALTHLLGLSASLSWSQAQARFGAMTLRVPAVAGTSMVVRALPFWLLALPLVLRLWHRNAFDSANTVLRPTSSVASISFAVLLGVTAAVIMVIVTEGLTRHLVLGWLLPRFWERGKQGARRLGRWLGPGYIDPHTGKLEPGHGLAVTTVVCLAAVYIFFYGWLDPSRAHQGRVPTLAYVLGLLMLVEVIAAGLAFFLDRYRFPLLLSLIVYAALMGSLFPRDHYFYLRSSPQPLAGPTEAVEARRSLQEGFLGEGRKPILTVVAAAGGGIQAAAWTTQVLTGLQRHLGGEFSRSIHLISSVSGGSVGAFFYLSGVDGEMLAPRPGSLCKIQDAAEKSSLEATAWGLTFPDFLRAFLPIGVNPDRDRAWALERAWLQAAAEIPGRFRDQAGPGPRDWNQPGPWLSDWSRHVAEGRLPAVIFNSTAVETGNQTYFSTLNLNSIRRIKDDARNRTLARLYDGKDDVPVVSAARLSATFPYVTPVARAQGLDRTRGGLPGTHFADGGYFDNFGVVAALEWLLHLEEAGQLEAFERILFLQISAFPSPSAAKGDGVEAAGWINSTLGPARTVLNVLTSSQVSRNELELALKTQTLGDKLEFVTFRPPRRCPDKPVAITQEQQGGVVCEEGGNLKEECEGLKRRKPPVSWSLARSDRKAIDCGWWSSENQGKAEGLKKWFPGKE